MERKKIIFGLTMVLISPIKSSRLKQVYQVELDLTGTESASEVEIWIFSLSVKWGTSKPHKIMTQTVLFSLTNQINSGNNIYPNAYKFDHVHPQ